MSWARGDLRARLALLVGVLAAALVAQPVVLALLLLAVEGLLLASGLGRRQKPLLWAALFATPFVALDGALHGAAAAFTVGGVTFYQEGLVAGLGFASRAVIAVGLAWWVLATTAPRDALRLLDRWPRAALASAGTLRFAPLAAEDWTQVREAQALRGHRAGKGWRGALASAPLLVPLVVATARRGQVLQEAIEASAFGSGPRTRHPAPALRAPDLALAGLGAALLAAALLRALQGAVR